MAVRFNAVVILALGCLLVGCTPNLIVANWQATGPPTVNAENSVEVPVRAVVRNDGDGSAGVFKLGAQYTESGGSFAVSFIVPGQTSVWYPFTSASLASGGEVTFDGHIVFHPSLHGETVTVTVTADSCSGDEFMPDYCRVDESNEGDNESASISVALP